MTFQSAKTTTTNSAMVTRERTSCRNQRNNKKNNNHNNNLLPRQLHHCFLWLTLLQIQGSWTANTTTQAFRLNHLALRPRITTHLSFEKTMGAGSPHFRQSSSPVPLLQMVAQDGGDIDDDELLLAQIRGPIGTASGLGQPRRTTPKTVLIISDGTGLTAKSAVETTITNQFHGCDERFAIEIVGEGDFSPTTGVCGKATPNPLHVR